MNFKVGDVFQIISETMNGYGSLFSVYDIHEERKTVDMLLVFDNRSDDERDYQDTIIFDEFSFEFLMDTSKWLKIDSM